MAKTATPSTSAAGAVAAKKPAKPRMTAAERRAAQQARDAEAAAARERAMAEFNEKRPLEWLKLWAKAMQLYLLVVNEHEFRETNSWWFEEFDVNATNSSFRLEEMGYHHWVTEANLHPSDIERLHRSLDHAREMLKDYHEEQERKRQEALERQRKREAALSKLTAEERRLLNL